MAKRNSPRRARSGASSRKTAKPVRSIKRPSKAKSTARATTRPATRPATRRAKSPSTAAKTAAKTTAQTAARPVNKTAAKPTRTAKKARSVVRAKTRPARPAAESQPLDETLRTPPSSLDLDRRPSAARSGRAALNDDMRERSGMTADLTAGDVDTNWENAYFSGDEAPGGDNPTPDQEVVDEIGKALGVEYQDEEELKASDKVVERDKHRWELDPASAEDYKERK